MLNGQSVFFESNSWSFFFLLFSSSSFLFLFSHSLSLSALLFYSFFRIISFEFGCTTLYSETSQHIIHSHFYWVVQKNILPLCSEYSYILLCRIFIRRWLLAQLPKCIIAYLEWKCLLLLVHVNFLMSSINVIYGRPLELFLLHVLWICLATLAAVDTCCFLVYASNKRSFFVLQFGLFLLVYSSSLSPP